MKYIIDGYNVIHQLRQLNGKRLRSQREGLIRILEAARAQDKRLKDLTVIFDGQSAVSAPPHHSSVKIIFSRGKDADKKIKELIESSCSARDSVVVSDDRQVRFYAGSGGAKKLAVKDFLALVFNALNARQEQGFQLDERQEKAITQELEKLWLQRKD